MPIDCRLTGSLRIVLIYNIERNKQLSHADIMPVIPPRSHAFVHEKANIHWRNKIVQYVQDKGAVYAFHKKYGYGLRAQIFRIKCCIGETLLTQKIESQKCEGAIIANLIRQWDSFDRYICVKAT
ncbi:MAG: hypothetical protein V4568_11910 [Pseudomonadota bacterium]